MVRSCLKQPEKAPRFLQHVVFPERVVHTAQGEGLSKGWLGNVGSADGEGIDALHIALGLVFVLCWVGNFRSVRSPAQRALAEELRQVLPPLVSVKSVYVEHPSASIVPEETAYSADEHCKKISEGKYESLQPH